MGTVFNGFSLGEVQTKLLIVYSSFIDHKW